MTFSFVVTKSEMVVSLVQDSLQSFGGVLLSCSTCSFFWQETIMLAQLGQIMPLRMTSSQTVGNKLT
jgi:hypothetical protein